MQLQFLIEKSTYYFSLIIVFFSSVQFYKVLYLSKYVYQTLTHTPSVRFFSSTSFWTLTKHDHYPNVCGHCALHSIYIALARDLLSQNDYCFNDTSQCRRWKNTPRPHPSKSQTHAKMNYRERAHCVPSHRTGSQLYHHDGMHVDMAYGYDGSTKRRCIVV